MRLKKQVPQRGGGEVQPLIARGNHLNKPTAGKKICQKPEGEVVGPAGGGGGGTPVV